ncbi:LAGLIDADG family homing endonuclease [Fictibacillus fluitans]|uniref:LAGLIDADG family homing endonuclease n=1 Tax=Fictibacillus fluitans TaxID=3058422 RepID=A0ABT8HX54_9BACL|nr:LAGLIDADG family homing endonuclease [Fictibacillus sp. NE201]MDN4525289.1 LAGLIDADG family homing endonuclease [Fictibacillus sp. NE201]
MERVNHKLRQRGYGARDKEELKRKIILLHDEGYSQVEIALRWNKEHPFFITRMPGEAGKLKSKKYTYIENYFEAIDTPNKAYILGFILGDGTIIDRIKSKRLIISVAIQDQSLIKAIAKELNATDLIKIRSARAVNEQEKVALTINSTKMCNDLIQLGVLPNKTGKEKWINLENIDLQWAFLRGFFDADGHIRVYFRNEYLKVRVGFTVSYLMLTAILGFLKSQQIGLNVNSIASKQGCYDIYLSSISDILQIKKFLYQNGELRLARKYDKFSSLMI